MKELLLSICVPTRNRASRLQTMLNSLLPQIDVLGKERIQIVISNNASEDNTDDVIRKFIDKGIEIEYYKQLKTIGNTNLNFVVSKAKGKYILLSGDDDIYAPNFISTIQPYLESENELGILHWNRLSGDDNCTNNQIHDNQFEQAVIEYPTFDDFIEGTMSSSNFISSVIFNAKCWNEAPLELISRKWIGYKTWSRIIFGASKLNLRCIYYYFPLVLQRMPLQKEWTKLWSYYAIYELGSIFDVLDKTHPGLLNKWLERLHDKTYYNIEEMIDGIICDVDFYREHQIDMEMYLMLEEKKRLRRWLNAKDPQKEQRKYKKRMYYKSLVKKILKHLI